MPQLNLYVPADVAASLKDAAAKENVSLSGYVLSLLSRRQSKTGWPEGYFERACGFLSEDMAESADVLPEPVEDLDLVR